jgi:hypothetical protein
MLTAIAYASSLFILGCETQEPPVTFAVRGVVLNSVSREPVARALVDGHGDAILTDAEGRFALNLPGGDTQIEVRRPGYNSKSQHLVQAGKEMPDLTFYLTPQASIAGHVLLSGGRDADGIRIMAYHRIVANGRENWMLKGSFVADSDGGFRIVDLDAPGYYLLCSVPKQDENPSTAAARGSFGYPSVCYPGGADISSSALLALVPGQQAQVDINLTWQPFFPIAIAVSNHAQGVAPSIQIRDPSGRAIGLAVKWNKQQGLAEVNLPSGFYYAEARSQGEIPSYGRTDFQVMDRPVSGLSLVVLPLRPIEVRIRREFTESGISAPPSSLQGDSMGTGVSLTLAPLSSPIAGIGGAGRLRPVAGSSDHGLFEMNGVVPGTYNVQTTASLGYVSSISSGAVDLAHEPLVIGPGNSTALIEITLRNDSGSISGTVNPPSSMGDAPINSGPGELGTIHVYAIPLFQSSSQIASKTIQSGNHFNIANLAPGSYAVLAFDKQQEIDASDPQQLSRFVSKGQVVVVPASGSANVQLDLIEFDQEGATP